MPTADDIESKRRLALCLFLCPAISTSLSWSTVAKVESISSVPRHWRRRLPITLSSISKQVFAIRFLRNARDNATPATLTRLHTTEDRLFFFDLSTVHWKLYNCQRLQPFQTFIPFELFPLAYTYLLNLKWYCTVTQLEAFIQVHLKFELLIIHSEVIRPVLSNVHGWYALNYSFSDMFSGWG